MGVATARTISLQGAIGHLIDVQVDVASGMVATSFVGRPDKAVSEGRDRCRSAIVNNHFEWPSTRRVTVLLSPADLPKRGTHFDLAIAAGVLAASEQVPKDRLAEAVLIGELTLDGGLRTVPGVLPMAMAATGRGVRQVLVPEPQVAEAALVPGIEVIGLRSLGQLVAWLKGTELPSAPPVASSTAGGVLTWRGEDRLAEMDLLDLDGMAEAKLAAEVAAAGGHHLLLSGPKGAGKTSLAERIPGLLPDLTPEESLEVTTLHSLAGTLDGSRGLVRRPPFLAPHHSSTRAAVLGGGSGRVRPGDLSRSHCGVLLLDEFPLLTIDILESLRQPLESGEVTIGRGDETATFPARGMVVLACNPCPCGNYTSHAASDRCSCLEPARRDYRRKLSGPIVDRIDITRHVEPVSEHEGRDPFAVRESTADVRARVAVARERQAARYADQRWRLNAHVPGSALGGTWRLADDAARRLETEVYAGRLTRRGAVRVQRLAWTVADLAGNDRPGGDEVDVALALRSGTPLPVGAVERRVAG